MEQDLTYSAAYAELENIALEMESESVSIDELALRVKRAAELIDFCQKKLRNTEKEVAGVMASMEEIKSGTAKTIPAGQSTAPGASDTAQGSGSEGNADGETK